MTRESDDQPSEADQDRVQLEYFAPADPSLPGSGWWVTIWSVVLLAGWLPFVCGIVSASARAIISTPSIIAAHTNGALLMMGLGMCLSIVGLVGFSRLRHNAGVMAGLIVLLLQISIAICAGMA